MPLIDPSESARRMEAMRQAAPLRPGAHRAELAQATTNRVGDAWATDSAGPVASLALPLHLPGARPAAPPPVQAAVTPPPTEASLRANLKAAIARHRLATAEADRAGEAVARADSLVVERGTELSRLDAASADSEMDLLQALRSSDGRPRFGEAEAARRVALRAEVDALERVHDQLVKDLVGAASEAAAEAKVVELASVRLSLVEAGRLAEKVFELEAEAVRLRELVHGADVPGVSPPLSVKQIFGRGDRFLRPVDRSQWAALRQRLIADPNGDMAMEG